MSAQPKTSATKRRGFGRSDQGRSSRRGRAVRGVVVTLVVVICLALIATGAGAFYVQQTLPQTSGSLAVAGLQQRTYIARDTWGVPHITAPDSHDLYFAQGYVTAQDRLFQMEFNRRVAAGRLAEMFGAGSDNSLVDADAFLRTLGLYRAAGSEFAQLSPAEQAEFQAYADGVNAFLTTHQNTLPLEFTILGIKPQPWTPLDSLAYGRVVALSLDSQWYVKYTRALVVAKAGAGVESALFPTYPASNPTLFASSIDTPAAVVSSSGIQAQPAQPHAQSSQGSSAPTASSQQAAYRSLPETLGHGATVVHEMLGSLRDSIGSNDWVVDGSRTASHLPLLANDPHLGINMPSIWYEVALRGGGLDAIGFSFPGDPGIIIGHNQRIAWGVTNVGADNSDLYYEHLDPLGHPGQYLYEDAWLPLQTRRETINVRGGKPVTITVTSTRDGPIINGVVSDVKGLAPLSLKWTALQPGYTFAGFFEMDSALNWNQFLTAVSHISISQNFVYADVDGNIGYRMSGLLPLRPAANRYGPVDGSVAANDWTGYVPQSQMPTLFNPTTHIIATANQEITPNAYPYYVTTNWDQGYRARRIVDLLATKTNLTTADYAAIQADVYSVPAATLTPSFISIGAAAGGDAAKAAALLRGWDYRMTRGSVAASMYEVTAGTLARETLEPVLGKKLYSVYEGNMDASAIFSVLINLTSDPQPPFFGATSQSDVGARRDAAVAKALADAYAQLRAARGSDTAHWTWGALHTATFAHPLASVSPLNLIFGVAPVQRPGDNTTINVGGDGGFSADPPNYAQHTVSSMREIIDLSNLDNSRWVTTTGESGQPFSAHYTDLIPLWDRNQYEPMAYSPGAVARVTAELLTLTPR